MARKTLLTESEIRRFMKLANMGAVGDAKIHEYGGMPPGARDDELEATEHELGDMDSEADREGDEISDLEGDLGAADDELAADDAAMDDMGAGADGMMVSIDDFMTALESVDSVVNLAADEEAPEEGGDDLAPEMPEEPAEPEAPVDVGMEEEEVEFSMQEQLVNKVAQRVAARLVKENRKTKLTDELTERIFKRLTQK